MVGHDVVTARRAGFDRLTNRKLLVATASAGFDALITVDKNLADQQNQGELPIAVVRLETIDIRIRALVPLVPELLSLLGQSLQKRIDVIPDQREQ